MPTGSRPTVDQNDVSEPPRPMDGPAEEIQPTKTAAEPKPAATATPATDPKPAATATPAAEQVGPIRPGWSRELVRFGLIAVVVGLTVLIGVVVGPRLALLGGSLPAGTPIDQVPSAGLGASPRAPVVAGTPSPGAPSGPVSPGLPSVVPTATGAPSGPAPTGSAAAAAAPKQAGRPADDYGAWAVALSGKLDIPAVALQAYGYAETVLAATNPQCQLPWTVLAGIGKIESNHGRFGNATVGADGVSNPRIIGVPLNGTAGNKSISDSDGGRIDGDATYDRAVGPMQFIPTTWARYGVDADKDSRADPFDIDDATLAAANYLCANGRNVSTGPGWTGAVLSYNATQQYVNSVYAAADDYGRRSLA
jgi:hypothetical protein